MGFWLKTMRYGAAHIFVERERETKEGFGNGLMVAIREARVKRNETDRERILLRYNLQD